MLTKDLVAASSKPLLLSILAGGESYGYEIIQKVRELRRLRPDRGGVTGCSIPFCTVWSATCLIDSEWKEADTGRERKYYFTSVPDGRKVLKTERQQWLAVHNTYEQIMENQNPFRSERRH